MAVWLKEANKRFKKTGIRSYIKGYRLKTDNIMEKERKRREEEEKMQWERKELVKLKMREEEQREKKQERMMKDHKKGKGSKFNEHKMRLHPG